jgi:glutamate formiminotransferase/formiminotetrahydrofolate cyclodeaminase
MVRMEAEACGVTPTWSEIVGLVPERVLFDAGIRHVRLDKFTIDQVLERKVRAVVAGGESLSGFVAAVASPAPVPGGGSVAAHAGALGAALAQMVAGLTIGKKKYAAVDAEMKEAALAGAALVNELSSLAARDAAAFAAVADAYKLPKEPEAAASARQAAITAALLQAAAVPLETAQACARVAELAAVVAERGNTNAASDAGVAALLAEAGARGASYNVRINVASLDDKSQGATLLEEIARAVSETSAHASRASAAVERAISL